MKQHILNACFYYVLSYATLEICLNKNQTTVIPVVVSKKMAPKGSDTIWRCDFVGKVVEKNCPYRGGF